MSNRIRQKMLILFIILNIPLSTWCSELFSFQALLVLSLFSQFFFFVSQHSRPDFGEIPHSTSCLSGVRTNDTKIAFRPNTDICSQICDIFLGLKFLIPTTYKPLLSEQLLPINASLEEFHLIFPFLEMVVSLVLLTSSQCLLFTFSSFMISHSTSPQCQNIRPLAVFLWKFREECSHSKSASIAVATFKSTFKRARTQK